MTTPTDDVAATAAPQPASEPPLTWRSRRLIPFRLLVIGGLAVSGAAGLIGTGESLSRRADLRALREERTSLAADSANRLWARHPVKRVVRLSLVAYHESMVRARLRTQWTTGDTHARVLAGGAVMVLAGGLVRRRARRTA